MTGRNHEYFESNHQAFLKKILASPVTLQPEPAKAAGGFTVIVNRKTLNSGYNPLKEASKIFQSLKYQDQKNILLIGLGLGYGLKNVEIFYDKNIFIFEPDLELVRLSTDIVDYAGIGSRNRIEFLTDVSEAGKLAGLSDIFIMEHPVLTSDSGSKYVLFREELISAMKHRLSDLTTSGYFSGIWFRNTLRNMRNSFAGSIRLCEFPGQF